MDEVTMKEALTVSELNNIARSVIEGTPSLQEVWVKGEISNLRSQSSGHLYFSLKDENAQVRCVMFMGRARLLRFRPQDELKVLICGNVSLYERDGQYQVLVSQMEPLGMGSMAMALEQLKVRLAAEGLFAAERKRALPAYPSTVGIVTSPSGAALRDMIQIMQRRNPKIHLILAPSLVQGEGAASQIVAGIEALNRLDEVEVIIVGRGGGSLEDLWCFNEEIVARAIYSSRLPIVSAVGHETDFTVSDMVADLRAPTPSAAAELVVPEAVLLMRWLSTSGERLESLVTNRLRHEQESLAAYQERLDPQKLLLWVAERKNRLVEQKQRMGQSVQQNLARQKQTLELMEVKLGSPATLVSWTKQRKSALLAVQHSLMVTMRQRLATEKNHLASEAHKLQLLSPLHQLARGYVTVRDTKNDTLIQSVMKMRSGDDITIEFSNGQVYARVLHIIPKEEA